MISDVLLNAAKLVVYCIAIKMVVPLYVELVAVTLLGLYTFFKDEVLVVQFEVCGPVVQFCWVVIPMFWWHVCFIC